MAINSAKVVARPLPCHNQALCLLPHAASRWSRTRSPTVPTELNSYALLLLLQCIKLDVLQARLHQISRQLGKQNHAIVRPNKPNRTALHDSVTRQISYWRPLDTHSYPFAVCGRRTRLHCRAVLFHWDRQQDQTVAGGVAKA